MLNDEELRLFDQSTPAERVEVIDLVSHEIRAAMADRDLARVKELDALNDKLVRRAHSLEYPDDRPVLPPVVSDPHRHLMGRA